jgi:hypothetical protein
MLRLAIYSALAGYAPFTRLPESIFSIDVSARQQQRASQW